MLYVITHHGYTISNKGRYSLLIYNPIKIKHSSVKFYLCFVRTRKKLDKYFKINRIRNKQIIDIKKIMEEEKVKLTDKESIAFLKFLFGIKSKWQEIKVKTSIIYLIFQARN